MRKFEVVRDEFRKHPEVEIKLPTRATEYSAGYDIYSPVAVTIQPGENVMIATDVKVSMYYDNAFIIIPRSSMGKYNIMLSNSVGLIDSDFYENPDNDGGIGVRLFNLGDKPYEIKIGDRIAQGIFIKYGTVKDDTTTTKRIGGWGSTNK